MFWDYFKFINIFVVIIFITVSVVGLLGLLLQKIVVFTLVGAAMLTIFAMVWEACSAEYIVENRYE